MGGSLGEVVASPGLAYGAAQGVAMLAKPLGEGIRDEINRDAITAKRADSAYGLAERMLSQRLKQERYARLVQQNTARLAAADPQLYTNVLAGRRLPMDAVRIGGQDRTDLMEEFALAMGQGEFAPSPSAQELAIRHLSQ